MRYFDEGSGLYFETGPDSALICDARNTVSSVAVPESYNSLPVTGIGKKAFLGCKHLRTLYLPPTVKTVGDWAFAGCDALTEVNLPAAEIEFGRGVFERDKSIQRINVEGRSRDTAFLMAAAVRTMEAAYLLDTAGAGSSSWLRGWDQKLSHIMEQKDDEGYHLYVLCGEEDLHFDYEQYMEYNKRKKSGLAMLRLLHPEGLEAGHREALRDYVSAYRVDEKGGPAWGHVQDEHEQDLTYYELLIELGCIDRDNLETALSLLGAGNARAKAYLLGQFNRDDETEGYFEDMMI